MVAPAISSFDTALCHTLREEPRLVRAVSRDGSGSSRWRLTCERRPKARVPGGDSLILLTLGTGVGSGIIIGELNVEAAYSHGSECDHMIVKPSETARMCPCGQLGHREAYCSARSLVARAEGAIELVMETAREYPRSSNRTILPVEPDVSDAGPTVEPGAAE